MDDFIIYCFFAAIFIIHALRITQLQNRIEKLERKEEAI